MYYMLNLPNLISRRVIAVIERRRFSLEEGLRRVIKDDSIVIPSNTNIAWFRNINAIDDLIEASMSKLMATLSCLVVGVVCVQL